MRKGFRHSLTASLLLHACVAGALACAMMQVLPRHVIGQPESSPRIVLAETDDPTPPTLAPRKNLFESLPQAPKLAATDPYPWPVRPTNTNQLLAAAAPPNVPEWQTTKIGAPHGTRHSGRHNALELIAIGSGGPTPGSGGSAPATSAPEFPASTEVLQAGAWDHTAPVPLPGNPAPIYPAAQRRAGIEGIVRVRITISADGRVRYAIITRSSGSEPLDTSALIAVRRWRFQPVGRGATEVTVDQQFQFALTD